MISNCRRTFGRFITFINHQFSEGFCNMLIPSQVESLRSFSDIYTVTVTFEIIYYIIHQKKMSKDQHVTYSSETGWSIKVINRLIVFPQMEITYFFYLHLKDTFYCFNNTKHKYKINFNCKPILCNYQSIYRT